MSALHDAPFGRHRAWFGSPVYRSVRFGVFPPNRTTIFLRAKARTEYSMPRKKTTESPSTTEDVKPVTKRATKAKAPSPEPTTNVKPKTAKSAKATETPKPEPVEAKVETPKKATRSKPQKESAEETITPVKTEPKAAAKPAKPAKPAPAAKVAAATKKPTKPTPSTKKLDSKPASVPGEPALPVATSQKKKPPQIKSLAELVEEEKANPTPRPKKKPVSAKKPVEETPTVSEPMSIEGLGEITFRPSTRGKAVQGRSQRGQQTSTSERQPKNQKPDNRRQQAEKKAPEPVIEEIPLEFSLFEGDLSLAWRPAKPKVSDDGDDESIGGRKSKRRRRKDRKDVEISAAAALEPESPKPERKGRGRGRNGRDAEPVETEVSAVFRAKAEKIPEIPPKPVIPIPADAPRVILRDGIATLVRANRVLAPIAFFGSAPDERRAQTVLTEIQRAAEAGIHVHSLLVEFEVDQPGLQNAVDFAAYMLSEVVNRDPLAQVLFRVVFAAPRGWESKYPNAAYQTQQGRAAEPSVSDEAFWSDARELLKQFVSSTKALPSAEHILGLHLDRGEWFNAAGAGYDISQAATEGFRSWLRTRYGNDLVAFRAMWFDGQVKFNTVQIPKYQGEDAAAEGFMRTNRRDRSYVDYHLFLSDATVNRISDLAYAVKEASEGYFLVGVSYGYTFEWSHPASGHLGLGKLLRTREVDYIAGPPSYRSREPGGDAPFPVPIDSLALNRKLYISEEDFKTSIGEYREPDDYNPVIRTPQALESVHWRGIGAALAHGTGACWMDLWGNGWLNTQTIWERGAKAHDLLVHRMKTGQTDPDVAVFIDERALAYLVDQHSFALLVQDVRESVLRSGLSAGFYLLSDLAHRENFPDCKLYVFLNAWDIRPEHRLAIKTRLQQRGKVLFWLYCAGMFDSGREALERAREITGIAIKPQPFHSKTGTTMLNRRHPLCEAFAGKGLIGGAHVDPSYFAIPENGVVLGEYSSSGLPSFVVREFNEDPDTSKHWTSVFMGEPFVTPGLLRGLAQMAGAHVWNYHSDVVHVRPPFLTVHCTGAGQRAIALPRNWSAFNLLSNQWEAEESSTIRIQGHDGSTHLFMVGDKVELEQILGTPSDTLLNIDQIPLESEDSVRFDTLMFDIPIMRLDEFIEGDPDEVADEWFLKPSMIEGDESLLRQPQAQESRPGRRRRRRSTPDTGGQPEGRSTGRSFDEEAGMNIMFRKRE